MENPLGRDAVNRSSSGMAFLGAKYDDKLATLMATLDIFIQPGAKKRSTSRCRKH